MEKFKLSEDSIKLLEILGNDKLKEKSVEELKIQARLDAEEEVINKKDYLSFN